MEKNELLRDGLLDENEIENMLINPLFTPSPQESGGDDGEVEDIINPSIDQYVSTPKQDQGENNSPNNKVVSIIRKNYNGPKGHDDESRNFRNQFHDLFDEYHDTADGKQGSSNINSKHDNSGNTSGGGGSGVNSNISGTGVNDGNMTNQELYSSHLLRGALASPGHTGKAQRLMPYNSNNNNGSKVNSAQIQDHSNDNNAGSGSGTSGINRRFQNKTRPAFVNKVWSMINDPANSHLIQWADDGLSLIVTHREQFVHEILPKYFKHSNFASFVRQLNMYGWHKVQDVKSGSIQSSSDDRWQFENEFFIRGREDLLNNIVRQKGTTNQQTGGIGQGSSNANLNFTNGSQLRSLPNLSGTTLRLMNEASMGNTMDVTAILGELEQIKFNQIALSKDLMRINKDNELLWKENMMARERHRTQQQALEKIFKFLRTVVPHADQKLLMDAKTVANGGSGVDMNGPTNTNSGNNVDMYDNSHRFDSDLGNLFDADHFMPDDDITKRRARYLLKNRTMSSTSSNTSPGMLNKHNDSSGRISEIPFEEEDEEKKNSSDEDSIEEISNVVSPEQEFHDLKANLHEQEARIKHLEQLVETQDALQQQTLQNNATLLHQHQQHQQQQQQQQETQNNNATLLQEQEHNPLNINDNSSLPHIENIVSPGKTMDALGMSPQTHNVMTPLGDITSYPAFDISDYLNSSQAQTPITHEPPQLEENPTKKKRTI
ncbi:hypothetical protein RNJ44_01760 [Nakaseomyces bracarensis]|uniref:HSF-type DNA-binding domain-containing protein n=1 Tax=Nakaseomyces bracarensis TaxID=273131 RepID=A0ABR4NNQ5_9SACH